jgi:hypothetical protein
LPRTYGLSPPEDSFSEFQQPGDIVPELKKAALMNFTSHLPLILTCVSVIEPSNTMLIFLSIQWRVFKLVAVDAILIQPLLIVP